MTKPTKKQIVSSLLRALSFACLIFVILRVWGCATRPDPPRPETQISKELKGSHLLRQIESDRSVSGRLTRSYFLFGTGGSGTVSTEYKVTLAWLGNDGVYRYTTLPLNEVRVVTNPNILQPFVRFRWMDESGDHDTVDDLIRYVVIGVNPKDWPEEIDMPLKKSNDR